MNPKLYFIPLALSMVLGTQIFILNKQKPASVATTQNEAPTPVPTPTQTPLTEDEKIGKFVDSYLQQITTAGDGTGYYCKADDVVSFYSPRKYEILRVESGGDIAIVRVRLESNNAGGQPIINNYSFYMKKQKAVFYALLKEVGEYNYCIRRISDI